MTPTQLYTLPTYQNVTCGLPTPPPQQPLIVRLTEARTPPKEAA